MATDHDAKNSSDFGSSLGFHAGTFASGWCMPICVPSRFGRWGRCYDVRRFAVSQFGSTREHDHKHEYDLKHDDDHHSYA